MSPDDPFRFIREVDLQRLLEAARPKVSEASDRLAHVHARRGARRRGQLESKTERQQNSRGEAARRERRAVENAIERERADSAHALLVTFRRYEAAEMLRRESGEFDLPHRSTMPTGLVDFIVGAGLRILSADDPEHALRDFLRPSIRGPRPDDAWRQEIAAAAAHLEEHGGMKRDDAFAHVAETHGVSEETVRAAYYCHPARSRLLRQPI